MDWWKVLDCVMLLAMGILAMLAIFVKVYPFVHIALGVACAMSILSSWRRIASIKRRLREQEERGRGQASS